MSNDFGIKISQSGQDVNTAAKEKLVFTSKYDTLKLYASGSVQLTVPKATGSGFSLISGHASTTISHPLGYVPLFIVFANNPLWTNTDRFSPYTYKAIGGGNNNANYAIDASNLTIGQLNSDNTSSQTFTYHYFIFYNSIT